MMTEKKESDKRITLWKIEAFLAVIISIGTIAFFILIAPLLNASQWKNNVDIKITQHDEQIKKSVQDIESLKMTDQKAERILIELQINLKNYMNAKGYHYEEGSKITNTNN